MHSDGTDIVGMCLERCDLLRGVVVVDAQLEVIRAWIDIVSTPGRPNSGVGYTCNYPVLPRNEATRTHRYVGELECLDNRL